MITMILKTTVADYDAWKKEFDDSDPVRKRHGAVSHTISLDSNEASKITVISKWPNLASVRGYLAVQRADTVKVKGAVSPEITLLEDVEEHSYAAPVSRRAKSSPSAAAASV
jgi:hypothetical protein